MRKIKIWLIANTTQRKCWRVTYPDGGMTRLLSYGEAINLKWIYGGVLWIDYENAKI